MDLPINTYKYEIYRGDVGVGTGDGVSVEGLSLDRVQSQLGSGSVS